MRYVFSILMVLSLAACSGGAGVSSDAPAAPPLNSANADAEAARAAAIYRYMQGLGSLMLANLAEVGIGSTRAGAVPCSGGGSATYADTTPAPGADPQAAITFDGCIETIGKVDGTMQVHDFLVRLKSDGTGTFNVGWSADVVIDGYAIRYANSSGLTTRSPGGVVSIDSFGGNDVALTLTAPNGQSVQFSDARITVQYDPSAGTVDFGGSNLRMEAIGNGELGAKLLPADLRAPVTAATAVASIGAPLSGSFSYQRSFDLTANDVIATGVTSGGLLNLTVDALPPTYGFPGSAGQYAWSLLLRSPDLSLPAGAP